MVHPGKLDGRLWHASLGHRRPLAAVKGRACKSCRFVRRRRCVFELPHNRCVHAVVRWRPVSMISESDAFHSEGHDRIVAVYLSRSLFQELSRQRARM